MFKRIILDIIKYIGFARSLLLVPTSNRSAYLGAFPKADYYNELQKPSALAD